MSRYSRGNPRRQEPNLPKVQEVELIDDPKLNRRRLILFIIFLAVGLLFLSIGVRNLFAAESGWQRIEVMATLPHFEDIELYYDFTDVKKADQNRVSNIFSTAAVELYDIFSLNSTSSSQMGIANLNRHPNERVMVEKELYEAFELLSEYGNRIHYLGPIHEYREALLFAQSDETAMAYDPNHSGSIKAFYEDITELCMDENNIRLELCENNEVILHVSAEYEEYARENELYVDGVVPYISLGYLKNAFVIDSMAERFAEAGLTQGYLSSRDGFSRFMDTRNEEFSMVLVYHDGNSIRETGSHFVIDRPLAMSVLRSYPMTEQSLEGYYYVYSDREIVPPYFDENGNTSLGIPELISYSDKKDCAEILLSQLDIYLTDATSDEEIAAMQNGDIASIYIRNGKVITTDPAANIVSTK